MSHYTKKIVKVLLTGGAGFIGSHIADELLRLNYYVRVVDNLVTGDKNNICHLYENKNFEFMYGDITNLETCRKACDGVDLICHQAALGSVPRSVDDPLSSHNSNVNGFLNILIAAKEKKIKRIVYASSSSVYGDDKNLPKQENKIGKQLSPYAITKRIDEMYAEIFTSQYGLECIGLRYFNVFGPRQNPNGAYAAVIPKFIKMIKNGDRPIINGDGSYSRGFTFVKNVVSANILALTTTNKECYGNVFNISTGDNLSILDIFNIIKKILKSNIEPIFGSERIGDIPHSRADISNACKYLNYKPIITFNTGIEMTVNFFK